MAHTGGLRQKPGGFSYEGKLFATSAEDAARFGRINEGFLPRLNSQATISEVPIIPLARSLCRGVAQQYPQCLNLYGTPVCPLEEKAVSEEHGHADQHPSFSC